MPQKTRNTLICLLLAGVTLAVYWPVTGFDFINFDDPEYVIYNTTIHPGITPAGVAWAFKAVYAGNWHPLSWISHMADCAIFGLNPGGHHFTNLLFHTANSVLVFLVLLQLTGAAWRGALVAALFAWHPLHVESVAWISERKDVLSAFFWLLTISAYAKYVHAVGAPPRARKPWYYLALVSFALGLLAKPMVVTLPFVLLLLDYWPLNRIRFPGHTSAPHQPRQSELMPLLMEKLPFFALAALDCFAAFLAQKSYDVVVSTSALPMSERLANALVCYVLYLWKMVWPQDLALPYPYTHQWSAAQTCGAALLLGAVTALALWQVRARPWLIVGWLWFLGTLVPVIGLVQVGIQCMADRYSYLPLLGVFIMAAWSIPVGWTLWPRPGLIFSAVVAGLLLSLIAGMETQLQYWRDSVTLFSHTVAVTSGNILAEYNLGATLTSRGDKDAAVLHYQKALAMHPNAVEAGSDMQTDVHFNLGLIYRSRRQWTEAEQQFRDFITRRPNLPNGHYNLAMTLIGLGRVVEATREFHNFLHLDPREQDDDAHLYAALDTAYAAAGHYLEAIAAAEKARAAALAQGDQKLAAAAEKRLATYLAQNPGPK